MRNEELEQKIGEIAWGIKERIEEVAKRYKMVGGWCNDYEEIYKIGQEAHSFLVLQEHLNEEREV